MKSDSNRNEKEKSMHELDAVKLVIAELVKLRWSFTGKTVHERMNNRRIRRDTPVVCSASEKAVSTVVRRLFNAGDPVFQGYGSTLTVPTMGPVLFFPLPAHAKKKVLVISEAFKSQLTIAPLPPHPAPLPFQRAF